MHCALWLLGAQLLSLGILLSLSGDTAHSCRLQTGLKNKRQIIRISVVGGLTDSVIFLCWCADGKGLMEFGQQNYSPV